MRSAELLRRARVIADYQFGKGAGRALFGDDVSIELSSSSRIRQIKEGTVRIATLRARDGLFTLSPLGGERLRRHFAPPAHRVVVDGEAAPFVRQGKTAFAKFVLSCSPLIRAGDEVLVVDEDDVLLATGRAVLSAREMLDANVGAAVHVRYGVGD
ncbi:PUA domain-containing protein [Methermicoccus shengliensis]|uniref:Pseudouridine synthase n=1 Tax=Methermicoccus shengliensis TaxID=660064 RepID=A0A832RYP2_9EURY|nr:PUA domain-containing protein [Methermicoccus shengliensis]KUK04127.1 MAG: Prefoldin molecular chaperone [Euryarchaeota archaeon 55_53]KUK29971.1 MAG: Prefoldin molecular chaperone [Methanosarcinales archeaon 56_1174]MDI3487975.1 hypothetical protein [Methanosarcinales archaeon]MDN5295571.1 hypothetical protein [Methanosarcinales archaeon]HIH70362.1 pseudouridine synthase [Methermicoccus shengliensis]